MKYFNDKMYKHNNSKNIYFFLELFFVMTSNHVKEIILNTFLLF